MYSTIQLQDIESPKGGHEMIWNGWTKAERPYSGASSDFQHYYRNGERVGYVEGYDYDGDWGYLAYKNNGAFIGRYSNRKSAQEAVERA